MLTHAHPHPVTDTPPFTEAHACAHLQSFSCSLYRLARPLLYSLTSSSVRLVRPTYMWARGSSSNSFSLISPLVSRLMISHEWVSHRWLDESWFVRPTYMWAGGSSSSSFSLILPLLSRPRVGYVWVRHGEVGHTWVDESSYYCHHCQNTAGTDQRACASSTCMAAAVSSEQALTCLDFIVDTAAAVLTPYMHACEGDSTPSTPQFETAAANFGPLMHGNGTAPPALHSLWDRSHLGPMCARTPTSIHPR